jgi:hypothetical protein
MQLLIDIEASGLGPDSYPIEIAIGPVAGGEIWSALICPDESWADLDWDETAAELHGITRNALAVAGKPAAEVAAKVWALLSGQTVYSDAPHQDGFWLERLRECLFPPPASITLTHIATLLPAAIGAAIRAGEIEPERVHRAAADVAAMQAFLKRHR